MTESETGSVIMDSASVVDSDYIRRGRSYSTGTIPACLVKLRRASSSTRLRGKLEASVAGLEELAILRENQRSLVEQAKGLAGRKTGPYGCATLDGSLYTFEVRSQFHVYIRRWQ